MSKMQTFYTLLTEPSEDRDPCLESLEAIAKADRTQIGVFKSDLEWTQWGEQTPDVANA